MKSNRRLTATVLLVMMAGGLAWSVAAQERSLPLASVRSGIDFAGTDVKALQDDAAANPAQLWLAQGRALWDAPAGANRLSCRSCHGASSTLQGAALRFPRVQAGTGKLINLEDQVRQCRSQEQQALPPAYESDELLALTLLVTQASQGLPLHTEISPELQPHWQAGAQLFNRRQGQLNLACSHCHDQRWGQRLYTDRLSQGQANAYPVYRLEWQKPGSLERRLRSCLSGVRAELPDWGDLGLRQLTLYLHWRGAGLPIELPAVRK